MLTILILLGAFVLLDLAALTFGADSRDGLDHARRCGPGEVCR